MDDMESHGYSIEWVQADDNQQHAIICESRSDDIIEENDDIDEDEYLVGEEIIPSTEIITISNSLDQIAAENLIYMAQDGSVAVMGDLIEEQVEQADNADYNEQQYFECQVTEEVITDDWVQQQGGERVEVPVDQLAADSQNDEIPLPTDEYTTSRPYPCDFCSRRFRKKANLMNHMVAHKNDRPHICNLCGARYIRKVDLLDHLKIHAQMPELEYMDHLLTSVDRSQHSEPDDEEIIVPSPVRKQPRAKKKPLAQQKPVVVRKQPKATPKRAGDDEENYTDDIKYLMDAARQHESYAQSMEERYPVTDANRPFVCQHCGVSFAREKALIAHSRLHSTDNALECDSCSEVFWDVALLREHQRIHHAGNSSNSEYDPDKDEAGDSESESFYCSVCGMSFHRIELLKRHARSHVKSESFTETFDFDPEVKHCCNVCGENFAEALDLLAHAEIHARNSLLYKCTLCGEGFVDENTIKKHITNFHGTELTENSCRTCGKHCKDSRSLVKHAWDHSREKKHCCTKCGKNFHNKARLKRHMQSHRNKSVTCNICGEDFPDGRSLMNHRHSHTNISGRQFPCRECGKTFGSRSSQQIHMRIHTGERPYGCRFCWKAFADGGTLRKHERIHTGEKPYACPVCPRAFNQRVVLREHIRSHHSSVDTTNGNSITPHYCVVCGQRFKTPKDIIQHLIEHSDNNTASKRQPTTGPRKYKRRRKLKPDELERLRTVFPEDSADELNVATSAVKRQQQPQPNDMDGDLYEADMVPYNKPLKTEKKSRSTIKDRRNDILDDMFDDLDQSLQNIAPAVMPSTSKSSPKTPSKKRAAKPVPAPTEASSSSRPKMIHTQKTRVAIEDGKRKSRTLITRSSPQTEQASKSSRAKKRTAAVKQPSKNDFEQIERSPNKRYNQRVSIKEEYSLDAALEESNLLLELSKKSINYSPDVVNDLEEILRSPIKSKDSMDERPQDINFESNNDIMAMQYVEESSPARNTRVSKRISNRQSLRQTPSKSSSQATPRTVVSRHKEQSVEDELIQSLARNIKQEKEESYSMTSDEIFTCEMCSAVFRDRAQLLVHVPIHI